MATSAATSERYGGFGAMMCNSLRHQEERKLCTTCPHSVFTPKPAMAAARMPAKKNPPVTLVDKAKTSSQRVTNHSTLAPAVAPAKKVAPAVSMPDDVPAPVFLDDHQVRAAAEAVMRAEPVHLPGILVEIVGLQMSCQGCLCKEHEMCGNEVLKEDVVVRLCMVQLLVEGKEEKAIGVVWVTDGIDCCRVVFLSCHMVKHAALYNGALVQVTRVFNGNPADWDSAERHTYHKNHGYTHAVIILDLALAPCFGRTFNHLGNK